MQDISVSYEKCAKGHSWQFVDVDNVLCHVFVTCENCNTTVTARDKQLAENLIKNHECKDTNWDHDKRMYVGYAFGLNRFF